MTPMRLVNIATVALGLLTVAWPVAWAPPWTYPLAGLGGLAVLAAARWRRGPALAVTAAIISCAASAAGIAVLAAEGLFILGYLLVAGLPAGLPRPGRWLRGQLPLLVAGLIAAGAVLAAFAVQQASTAWLTVAGLAAAVAAYLIALPVLRLPGRDRGAGHPRPAGGAGLLEQTRGDRPGPARRRAAHRGRRLHGTRSGRVRSKTCSMSTTRSGKRYGSACPTRTAGRRRELRARAVDIAPATTESRGRTDSKGSRDD
jgi:hypothetical protein